MILLLCYFFLSKNNFFVPGVAEPVGCPAGSYSAAEGLQAESECLNCTGGEFCNATGKTTTSGLCEPGYYCPRGSTSAWQIVCPVGHYCPRRTFHPYQCPSGTYSNGTGLTSSTKCTPCREGWYCDDSGLTEPKTECDPGFYCPSGQNRSNPYKCPAGMHCPKGSASPKPCPAGTFVDYPQASECHSCPASYYCVPGRVIPGET